MKRILVGLLTATICTSLFSTNVLADNNAKLKENDKKIEDLKKDKENLQGELDEVESQLKPIKQKLEARAKELRDSEARVQKKHEEIVLAENTIKKLEGEIPALQSKIKDAKEQLQLAQDTLDARVASMYKSNKRNNLVSMLITSRSFSEFLSTMNAFKVLADNDRMVIEKVNKLKEEIEASMKKLQESIEKEKKLKDSLRSEKAQLDKLTQYNKSKVDEVTVLEDEKQAIIADYRARIGSLNSSIFEIEADSKAIVDSMNAVNNSGAPIGNANSQGFIMPANGPITSHYGWRIHPVTGVKKKHHGTDIGVPMGSPIFAAKDGVVAKAEYHSAYGNMVVINHGGGVQTLYAHNSQLLVSVGQSVTQGQVIAKAGSTGLSTGPHCHWELRINGVTTNPLG